MYKLAPKLSIYLALALVLMVSASGCKKDSSSDKSTSSQTAEPATVKLQLVSAQIQLAGLYAAFKEGYFADQNLTVEPLFTNVVDTLDTLAIVDLVTSGQADFGLTTADNLIKARDRGDDVVALMTIYQRDPTAIISLANKNITRPEDLKGKKVLVFNRSTSMSLFMTAANLDPSEVTIVEPPDGNVNAAISLFLTGQVDAMVATGTDASAQMKAIGIEHNLMYFNDYGVQMYPNIIFTTRAMMETHADVVQRFIDGMLDGMKYAVSQPDAISTWFVENYGDQLRPDQLGSQDEAMLAIIPLMQSSDSKPGMMSADVWTYVYDGMTQAGMINPTVSISQAYTTRFLDNYYKQ